MRPRRQDRPAAPMLGVATLLGSLGFSHGGCIVPPDPLGRAVIPDTVTIITTAAFEDCATPLQSLVVSDSVTLLSSNALVYTHSLRTVALPTSVTAIHTNALPACLGFGLELETGNNPRGTVQCVPCDVRTLVIPDGVVRIGTGAFDQCSSVVTVLVSDSVASINSQAFWRTRSLQTVRLPSTVTSISSTAFPGCLGFGITLNGQATRRGNVSCIACAAAALLVLPDTVAALGTVTFRECQTTVAVALPDSLRFIGAQSFMLTGLVRVDVPSSVTRIGAAAFASCQALQTLTLPDGIAMIPQSLCSGCIALAAVHVPSGVTTVWSNAFLGCTALGNVSLPNGVSAIGRNAFRRCASLRRIALPDALAAVTTGTFEQCTALQEVTIPDGVTAVGDSAFGRCHALAGVTLPDSVVTVGLDAFPSCLGFGLPLTNVPPNQPRGSIACLPCNTSRLVVPDTVAEIGREAFFQCSALTTVVLPRSLTALRYRAFNGCTNLATINIPNAVTAIGGTAFTSTCPPTNPGLFAPGQNVCNCSLCPITAAPTASAAPSRAPSLLPTTLLTPSPVAANPAPTLLATLGPSAALLTPSTPPSPLGVSTAAPGTAPSGSGVPMSPPPPAVGATSAAPTATVSLTSAPTAVGATAGSEGSGDDGATVGVAVAVVLLVLLVLAVVGVGARRWKQAHTQRTVRRRQQNAPAPERHTTSMFINPLHSVSTDDALPDVPTEYVEPESLLPTPPGHAPTLRRQGALAGGAGTLGSRPPVAGVGVGSGGAGSGAAASQKGDARSDRHQASPGAEYSVLAPPAARPISPRSREAESEYHRLSHRNTPMASSGPTYASPRHVVGAGEAAGAPAVYARLESQYGSPRPQSATEYDALGPRGYSAT